MKSFWYFVVFVPFWLWRCQSFSESCLQWDFMGIPKHLKFLEACDFLSVATIARTLHKYWKAACRLDMTRCFEFSLSAYTGSLWLTKLLPLKPTKLSALTRNEQYCMPSCWQCHSGQLVQVLSFFFIIHSLFYFFNKHWLSSAAD